MVFIDWIVGLDTKKLLVPLKFQPTKATHRGWIVNPFGRNPWWCFFAGFPPALLATILIFMDQQITAVIVNRKENKLRKGCGYHLDLLVIALQIGVCTVLGTPWFVAATVLSINHVRSLTKESESAAPGERPKFLGIREQRLTGTLVFVMVGLSAFMAKVLKFIPMSVLYGVFLFMGVSSLKGIQFVQRLLVVFMPAKYQPDYMYLRHVPTTRVHLFTAIQTLCLAGLCVIKEIKSISIVFPLMVLAMCFIRKALDYVFSRHELKWLDDIMPESHKREKEEKKKKLMQAQETDANGSEDADPTVNVAIFVPPAATPEPQCNISDEISKTSNWKHLDSDTQLRNRNKSGSAEKIAAGKNGPSVDIKSSPPRSGTGGQPVKFRIADDDDDELGGTPPLPSAPIAGNLDVKPPPYIMIESPSSGRISGAGGGSPTHV